MTDDEIRELRRRMIDDLDKAIRQSYLQGNWGNSPVQNFVSNQFQWSNSPTQSKGQDVYQEPERDEQGTFYGYKILHRHCSHPDCDEFVSPRYHALWDKGECTSDREPSESHMHGLHFTKSPDHPELRNYCGHFNGSFSYSWGDIRDMWVLVKCALSGTIVETEQGFRAQHAQIIGVLIDGNWKSYQDYQECTRSYSRPNPYEDEYWNISIKKREHRKSDDPWYIDWNPNP